MTTDSAPRLDAASSDAPPLSGPGRFGIVLAVAAVVIALAGGRTTRSSDVDGLGILFALPLLYWVGVGLAVVASGLLLHGAVAGHQRLAVGVPALWLLVAHTAPALAHAYARFAIVYIHLGFIRLIETEGTGDILIDARFAWPGFFASFVPSVADIDPVVLDWLMRLWPSFILGASAVLVAALSRRAYPSRPLIAPVSSLVFVLLSWTGQDYFSPQSVGFFLYLSIIIVIESGPLRPRGSWSSVAPILSRFATSGGDRPEARSTAAFVALVVLAFAAIVSHPLAPFFICAALAMLGFYGRTVAFRLLLIVGVLYLVWILVAAEPWWSTRIDELTGQFGSFFGNVDASTSGRVARSSEPHLLVTRFRSIVGLTTFLSVLAMGLIMATNRFASLRPALPLAPLAGIPVLAAGVQSYGGEIIIRVLLFTLPMASILIARMLLAMPRAALPIVVPLLSAAIIPVFMITRFGNESFEMTTAADREAVEVMYEEGDEATLYVADNAFLPWADFQRSTNDHRYRPAEPTLEWLNVVRNLTTDVGADRAIVVFTPSQSAYNEHVFSAAPDALDRVGLWLSTQPGVETLYQNDGAWVLSVPVP